MLLKGLVYISILVNSITQASVKLRCWGANGHVSTFQEGGFL